MKFIALQTVLCSRCIIGTQSLALVTLDTDLR